MVQVCVILAHPEHHLHIDKVIINFTSARSIKADADVAANFASTLHVSFQLSRGCSTGSSTTNAGLLTMHVGPPAYAAPRATRVHQHKPDDLLCTAVVHEDANKSPCMKPPKQNHTALNVQCNP